MAAKVFKGKLRFPTRLRLSLSTSPSGLGASAVLICSLLAVVFTVNAQEPTATPGATPEATPSDTMPRIVLPIEERNESDLGGDVTLYEFGDRTIVEFDVTGAGGDHPAYISAGTCTDLTDPPAYALQAIAADGTSRTVVNAPLQDLLDEPHTITIRMSQDDVNTIIGCAEIKGEPSLHPATPVATPAGTPASSPVADGTGGVAAVTTPAPTATATAPAATTTPSVTSTSAATSPDGTGGATNGSSTSATISLADYSSTGTTGTAILTAQGDLTRVTIQLTGDGWQEGQEVHLHSGTCQAEGSATYTLNPVDANGTSTTVVNLSLSQLLNNGYMINVHPGEANWDAWVVCGNLSVTSSSVVSPVEATTTPAGGTGSSVTTRTDGTSGGNTALVTTNAQAGQLPTRVGVGDGLRWPSHQRDMAIWSLAGAMLVMGTGAVALRWSDRAR